MDRNEWHRILLEILELSGGHLEARREPGDEPETLREARELWERAVSRIDPVYRQFLRSNATEEAKTAVGDAWRTALRIWEHAQGGDTRGLVDDAISKLEAVEEYIDDYEHPLSLELDDSNEVGNEVEKFKIERAGGGKLAMVTANSPIKVKITALDDSDEVVAAFTDKVKLTVAGSALTSAELETHAFAGGVLDGFEILFKTPGSGAVLSASWEAIKSDSEPLLVVGSVRAAKAVIAKTEKARAVLAEPPTNEGSAALAELRKMRPQFGLNNAPGPSQTVKDKAKKFAPDNEENCGAVSLGAICGKTSTEVVEGFLRRKLEDSVRSKVTGENPALTGSDLEAEVTSQLDKLVKDYNAIQDQSIYWRAQSLENLESELSREQAYGEACGEAQLAANREMLLAEAERRNDEGGINGVKYKVIQDGLNDSDNGKFYEMPDLINQMGKYPDGTQYQVFLNGPSFAGHWIYAEKYNGKVVIEDYQKASDIGKKGATGYTDGDAPHNPKDDSADVFNRGCFIALCPESADEAEITPWAENPKWPQGGGPPVVEEKEAVPEVEAVPERDVTDAIAQGTLATSIEDPSFQKGLVQHLGRLDSVDAELTKALISALRGAPEDATEVREKIFETVFACKLKTKGELPPQVLTKMVDILETLPSNLLPKEWEMQGVPGTSFTGGAYNADTRGGEIQYGLDDAPNFEQTYDANCPDESMGLNGSKNFDLIIRHEVGHDVDITQGGPALTKTADGGMWREHGTSLKKIMVEEMPDLLIDYVSKLNQALENGIKPAAIDELKKTWFPLNMTIAACQDEQTFRQDLASFLAQNRMDPKREAEEISSNIPTNHNLIKILQQGAKDDNWAHLGSTPHNHNGRVYILKSDQVWHSFQLDTWHKRISNYQYAAPGEWFAEFYAGVNNAEKTIRGKCAKAYPKAFKWLADKELLLHPEEAY